MTTKRFFALLLSICIIFTIASFPAMADSSGITEDGFKYCIITDYENVPYEVEIFGYTGSATELTVPAEIEGYPVTRLCDNAFAECNTVVSITIPNGVTEICDYAFSWCDALTSVTLPKSVNAIENYAFYMCESLAEINVDAENECYCSEDGVLFSKDKTELIKYPATKTSTNYNIPDTVNSIHDFAFEGCNYIESVTIPTGVVTIGQRAFFRCEALTSVTIPNTVTELGDSAFYGCYALESITLSESLTTIGRQAFALCKSLESITIPKSVSEMDCEYLFYNCYALAEINVDAENEHYSSLDGVLFNKGKTTLITYPVSKREYSYTIPDSVTTICEQAFTYQENLESVTVPAGVASIGHWAFGGYSSLSAINVDAENEHYSSLNGVLFSKDKTTLITYPTGKTEESYNIPDGVVTISDSAFFNCLSLKRITIPEGVTTIGNDAFYACFDLISIALPKSLEYIGVEAFADIDNLSYVYYSGTETDKNAITIQDGNYCLPDATWYYSFCGEDNHVFDNDCDENCNNCGFSRTPNHVYDDRFDTTCNACGDVRELTSPIEDFDYYTYEDGIIIESYNGSEADVVIPSKIGDIPVTEIASNAFSYCDFIESVTIPDSVVSIDDYAFTYCSLLKAITIPENVSYIGYNIFQDCEALVEINVDENNESFSSEDGVLFNEDKTTLITYPAAKTDKSYIVPDSVTSISEHAFAELSCLESITIPAATTSIGDWAFLESKKLIEINVDAENGYYSSQDGVLFNKDKTTLITYPAGKTNKSYIVPDSVTVIDHHAFYYCRALLYITIPASVTSIGQYSFHPPYLHAVYYEGSSSQKDSIVIGDGNFGINQATWYFVSCQKNGHTYDGSNDNECNACGYLRFATPAKYFSYSITGGEVTITDYTGSFNTVEIPAKIDDYPVTTIAGGAFEDASLAVLILPETIATIEASAFTGCDALANVYYQGFMYWDESNVSIGENNDCLSDAEWSYHYAGQVDFKHSSINPCSDKCDVCMALFEPSHIYDNDADLICNGCNHVRTAPVATFNYFIDNGEVTITEYTGNATEVVIPSKIENYPVVAIDDYAFYDCSSLVEINFPEGLKSIGAEAFSNCDSLTSVSIPDSVISIDDCAFFNCSSLISVEIGRGVQYIDEDAFGYNDSLIEINVDAENGYYSSEDGVLFNKDKTTLIRYLMGRKQTTYTIPNSVTAIGDYAFSNCDSLTSVSIPDSVTTIGDGAFRYCESLADVAIPEGVTTIGAHAFENCLSLKSIIIPEGVTVIADGTFDWCLALEYVSLPDSLEVISDFSFYRCTSLKGDLQTSNWSTRSTSTATLTIPDNVTTIGYYAFGNCEALESITLGASVETIGDLAFADCTALACVSVPRSITSIGDEAFMGCDALTEVKYDGTADSKENISFGDGNEALTNKWQNVPSYVSGDVNSDGAVNNKDLGILRRFLNNWDVDIDELASDVNRDGAVNNKDMGIIRRYLNNWDVELK